MKMLRLAYASQFLIALIAVFVLWSEMALAAHLAGRLIRHAGEEAPAIVEFAGYHAGPDGGLRTQVFLPGEKEVAVALPAVIPAALRRRSGAGGVLRTKVNERSSKIVIWAGMTDPALSAVRSLYAFVNSTMLMPCGPSAVPTGGAGVALPAGIWSFTLAVTFFAIR